MTKKEKSFIFLLELKYGSDRRFFMGVYIYLSISDSITKEEWNRIYSRSLKMAQYFPLLDKAKKDYYGETLICGVEVQEREWLGRVGWHTVGDTIYMRTAEDYFLPKELSQYSINDEVDAYMSVLPAYCSLFKENKSCQNVYHLWGEKTQGEPYHIFLLAIGCMMENELPGKVAVYGDITKGQCIRAAKYASEALKEEIKPPIRCDLKELYKRVRAMPLTEEDVCIAFYTLYFGNKDKEFGLFFRRNFTVVEQEYFWKYYLCDSKIGTFGFENWIQKYIEWGMPINKLKKFINFNIEQPSCYEEFIKSIMQTNIYIREKDCRNLLETDLESEEAYGVATQFAQFALAGARNYRVDRYIPLDILIKEITEVVGEHCNVQQIVTEYTKADQQKESSIADEWNEFIEEKIEKKAEDSEKYDISDINDLPLYEKGDKIIPDMEQAIIKWFSFYRGIVKEETYLELMNQTGEDRCRFLISQNISILLKENDWKKIFKDILENEKSFERYYPMVRVRVSSSEQVALIRAYVTNDEFYQYIMQKPMY